MAEPAAQVPPADLRLVVVGVAAWLSVLLALALPPVAGAVWGGVGILVAPTALALRRRWSAEAAVLLGCTGAAMLATSVRASADAYAA